MRYMTLYMDINDDFFNSAEDKIVHCSLIVVLDNGKKMSVMSCAHIRNPVRSPTVIMLGAKNCSQPEKRSIHNY